MKTYLHRTKHSLVTVLLYLLVSDIAGAIVIFPIATNSSFVEFAISSAFDGSNYLVGIQGDAVAHDSVTAQLTSSNGSLVGSKISTGEFGGAPRGLFDGTNY